MTEFVRASSLHEIPEPGTLGVELNGTPLVIVRAEGEVYALDEFCTHEDVSLADGEDYDRRLARWLLRSCFDLLSGKPSSPPATKALNTYSVRIDGNDVYAAVPAN